MAIKGIAYMRKTVAIRSPCCIPHAIDDSFLDSPVCVSIYSFVVVVGGGVVVVWGFRPLPCLYAILCYTACDILSTLLCKLNLAAILHHTSEKY